MKNQPVIVVRKKKGGHAGHHGGAWKVAYADFMTAMMAFFLVLWIVGQSAQVRAAVAGYFRDPGLFDFEKSTSIVPGGNQGLLPEPKPGEKQPKEKPQPAPAPAAAAPIATPIARPAMKRATANQRSEFGKAVQMEEIQNRRAA